MRAILMTCLLASSTVGCRKSEPTGSRPEAPEHRSAAPPVGESTNPPQPNAVSDGGIATGTAANPSSSEAETVATPPPVRADGKTLENVEQDIIARTRAIKTCRADVETKSELVVGGQRRLTLGTGKFDYERRGDKVLYRVEQEVTIVLTTGREGQTAKTATQKSLVISDGAFLYTLQDHNERGIRAFKNYAEPELLGFETLRYGHEVRLLPDAVVNGHEVYVVEAVLTATDLPVQPPMKRTVNYYLKDRGMLLGHISYDAQGIEVERRTYSHFEFDADIPDDRFVFTTPEGATLRDLTLDSPRPDATASPVSGEGVGPNPPKDP